MEAVAAAVPLQLQSALSVESQVSISVMQGLKQQDNFNQDSESAILEMIKTFNLKQQLVLTHIFNATRLNV